MNGASPLEIGVPAALARARGVPPREAQPVLDWLQALRGVAALMVLAFHLAPYWNTLPQLAVFTDIAQWGFAGVDVFFVLSGFVVCRTAVSAAKDQRIPQFLWHRLLRIYLGYWPALLLFAAVSVLLLERELPDLATLARSASLLQPQLHEHWLLPAWSLTLELYFYGALVALVLLRPTAPWLPLAGALAFLVLWHGSWFLVDADAAMHGELPLSLLLTAYAAEFLAGALLAELHARWRGAPWPPAALAGFGIIGVGGAWVGLESGTFNTVSLRALTFGVAAVALCVMALALQASRLRPPRWLARVGDASFSIYLLHTFLIDAGYHLGWVLLTHGLLASDASKVAFLGALPVAIVCFGFGWYRCVERPLFLACVGRPARRPAPASAGWAQRA
jgi:exopolysaccharide production protein ExoZ